MSLLDHMKFKLATLVHKYNGGKYGAILKLLSPLYGKGAPGLTAGLSALGLGFGMFGGIAFLALFPSMFDLFLKWIVPKSWLNLSINYA
jgi:hypothetical protein